MARDRNQGRVIAEEPSTSGAAIDPSNIGFKLLKKSGWKEGTGLGVSEQGRVDPVEAQWKNDKRGLGLETKKKKKLKDSEANDQLLKKSGWKEGTGLGISEQEDVPSDKSKRETNRMLKKMRKMQEEEKRLAETEFRRDFLREFWPDNV